MRNLCINLGTLRAHAGIIVLLAACMAGCQNPADTGDVRAGMSMQRLQRLDAHFHQLVKASTDPRITTAVVLNSGMITDDDQYMIRHELKRSVLDQMHAPIAYFIGGETDIAYANSEVDWKDLQQRRIPALNAQMDVGHGATYNQPNGGPFVTGPLAWLQWQLKGDAQARAMFVGDDCGFCSGNQWRLRRHLLK